MKPVGVCTAAQPAAGSADRGSPPAAEPLVEVVVAGGRAGIEEQPDRSGGPELFRREPGTDGVWKRGACEW